MNSFLRGELPTIKERAFYGHMPCSPRLQVSGGGHSLVHFNGRSNRVRPMSGARCLGARCLGARSFRARCLAPSNLDIKRATANDLCLSTSCAPSGVIWIISVPSILFVQFVDSSETINLVCSKETSPRGTRKDTRKETRQFTGSCSPEDRSPPIAFDHFYWNLSRSSEWIMRPINLWKTFAKRFYF